MQILLFLIFIAVPVIEIALFMEAGRVIGLLPTIAITIGTAIAGSFLMQVQGFAALRRFSEAVERGEMPVTPVIDGIGILAAGLLLLTPGLFTDALGLLLFVPPIRRGLAKWAFGQALKRGRVHVRTYRQSNMEQPSASESPPKNAGFTRSDDVIDVDFETIDPGKDAGDAKPIGGDNDESHRHGGKDSPWRPK